MQEKEAEMRKFLAIGVVAAFVLAACGGKSSSTNGSGAGGSGSNPSGGATGMSALTVNTGSAGSVGTVLVNADGLTLYHWKGETTSSLQCTGSCLSTWLIATVNGGGAPTGGMHVTGKLATFTRSDGAGTQITYNGMPLYTYTGDSKAGEANGQGLDGVWFAVTPSMSATGTSSGGGYNRGGGYGGGGYNP
jgi:predicted lipoprotein with Yx(FWY)xxD motif